MARRTRYRKRLVSMRMAKWPARDQELFPLELGAGLLEAFLEAVMDIEHQIDWPVRRAEIREASSRMSNSLMVSVRSCRFPVNRFLAPLIGFLDGVMELPVS
jgi:hypothetical protein